jgi:hypothetical protein
MGSHRFACWPLALLLSLSGITCQAATTSHGRQFAAFYRISRVTDLGAQVQVTLALQVFNYSGAELNNAKVTLQNSQDPAKSLGAFGAISVRRRASSLVSEIFVIPKEEYTRWRHGATPSVQITYTDVIGKLQQRPIELAPRFVRGGN